MIGKRITGEPLITLLAAASIALGMGLPAKASPKYAQITPSSEPSSNEW
jgi:hypothetical protein